jgi:acyl carrier protein
MKLLGHVDEISRSLIEGWVMDVDRPDYSVPVSVYINGVHHGMCRKGQPRADLVLADGQAVSKNCGFWFQFAPPLSPFIEQRIEVRETWSGEKLDNGMRVMPRPELPERTDAGIVPVLLTSTGRAGTTLLMSEFARHPKLVVGDHVPYEIKQIAYYAAAFAALATDADRERSTTPETMRAPEAGLIIGSNPYNMSGLYGLGAAPDTLAAYYERAVPSGYAELFRGFIIDFYRTLAHGQGKTEAAFFCEKGDISEAAILGARLFFPAVKDIILVRDPRDLLCSTIAFWKHRPDRAMELLTEQLPRLLRLARRDGRNTIIIRYEDLVRDAVNTRRALSEFLDLDLTLAVEPEVIPDNHRTSSDPAASIGRWREELSRDQADACRAAFGSFMREFGYDADTGGRARKGKAAARGRIAPDRPVLDRALSDRAVPDRIVVAQGQLAVNAFSPNSFEETEDGTPALRIFSSRFGGDGNGAPFTSKGWAAPERGFVWSGARENTLVLPALRSRGEHRLYMILRPFTHGTELPGQRVTVLLNGKLEAATKIRDISVVSVPVPRAVAGSDEPITLTLRLPDAARPSAVNGGDDRRLLGVALYALKIMRIEQLQDGHGSAKAASADDARLQAALEATLREALGQPGLRYHARTTLRDLRGFDAAGFVRLILALEAKFGVILNDAEVDQIVALGDIGRILRGKLGDQALSAEALPA